MEENILNNEAPQETPLVAEPVVESVAEPVVEAPMPEAQVEESEVPAQETPWEKYKASQAQEAPESTDAGAITTASLSGGSDTVQAVGSVENGVIGVSAVKRTAKKAAENAPKKSNKTVAIHSTKNVSWSGVGKVYRGYNIVTPEQAEKWLERNHIRLATPEEVAKEFGR